jgi:Ca2+-binding RTX toxin-like protein
MRIPLRTSLAAGLLVAGLAVTADAAHASYRVAVVGDTLLVKGNRASDDLALRRGGNKVEVDVGDDGSADFEVHRNRFDRIRVAAGGGNDRVRIDESQGAFTDDERTTLDGGRGRDTLLGGAGDERLKGGPGNDTADGNGGADTAILGSGRDTFVWDPGDGSDRVEGRRGTDKLTFNGSNAAEVMGLSPNGFRARFTRDMGNIVMDLNDIERVDTTMLGGDDQMVVNGTGNRDAIDVTGGAGHVSVAGLRTRVNLRGADRLTVNGRGDGDRIDASALPAGTVRYTADGGANGDRLLGSRGDDVLLGGDGADVLDSNAGDDVAFLGAGDDSFTWDPGDGSDTVEGQTDRDTLRFNGSGAGEAFEVAANGGRARFTRNVGNIAMDINDVEQIDTSTLGGVDTFTADDLSGTDLVDLDTDLGNDGADDRVIVNGTEGDDVISVTGSAGSASVRGLAARVDVTGASAADDDLAIHGLAGDDVLDGSPLAGDAIRLVGIGGDGDDILIGGSGPDTLSGNADDDVLLGGPGLDTLDGGPGNNTVIQD